MDDWPTDLSISNHSLDPKVRESGPLQTVSGNRQTYALDRHAGPENQSPQDLDHVQAVTQKYTGFTQPTTLRSNDGPSAISHLHRRQQKRRQNSVVAGSGYQNRSYLTSKEYLAYRNRPRKDLGRDGKQIWSDPVEDAFQEALFEIEPMGKTRRSNHKSGASARNARNDQIGQYIFRRTGERRLRKQVSSHIQLLNGFLKHYESWRGRFQVPRQFGSNPNKTYYENIIAKHEPGQSLISQRSAYGDSHYGMASSLPPPSQTLGSNVYSAAGTQIVGVNFEMWMSPNHANMDKRLHDFTSLQSHRDLPRCNPVPLEHLPQWRSSYPCLAEMLDGDNEVEKFDIFMIETSYKVMDDYPPVGATLGLRLELGYDLSCRSFFDWTCTTTIYRHGIPVQPSSHYRLEARHGVVKPTFESKWWASAFIDHLEQHKQAHEHQHPTFEPAQDFSSLTAVHEIRAQAEGGNGKDRGLVAVLLWKFSVAPKAHVGTTSWHRLIQPPSRFTTNSPSPAQEMALPPLAMDSMIREDDEGETYQDYHPVMDLDMAFADDGMDINSFNSVPGTFLPGEDNSGFPLDYHLDLGDLSGHHHHHQHEQEPYPSGPNFFDSPSQVHLNTYSLPAAYSLPSSSPAKSPSRHPLALFDPTAHALLQAQLANAPTESVAAHSPSNSTIPDDLAASPSANHLHEPEISASSAISDPSLALWDLTTPLPGPNTIPAPAPIDPQTPRLPSPTDADADADESDAHDTAQTLKPRPTAAAQGGQEAGKLISSSSPFCPSSARTLDADPGSDHGSGSGHDPDPDPGLGLGSLGTVEVNARACRSNTETEVELGQRMVGGEAEMAREEDGEGEDAGSGRVEIGLGEGMLGSPEIRRLLEYNCGE